MQSLNVEENRTNVFNAGEGAGQSGSFFFHSKDNKFLIKTLRGSEKDVLLGMLDDFIDHIIMTENKSLLARIYGLFTIVSNKYDPLDVIIMQNTCQLTSKKAQKMIFDLKGSTYGRLTKVPKQFWNKHKDCKKVLKDLNYIEINKDTNCTFLHLSE